MAKIAVDAVVLPCEAMMNRVIEANKAMQKQVSGKIVLDKNSCLPHISLAMGCIDEGDLGDIERVLESIARRYCVQKLKVVGVHIGTSSAGEKVSVFQIEKDETLQSLHKEVMEDLGRYFKYEATAEMVLSPHKGEKSTLCWIKNYAQKASFENFFPHITVGYGEAEDISQPIEFTASRLALCHLGNHCTCRKILASVEFGETDRL